MKKELMQAFLTALVVTIVVGGYFRLEGALPIAVTQTFKQTTFDVSGEGKVAVKPDQATISMGIREEAGSVAEATERVDKVMEELSKALKQLGIDENEIKTSSYSVYNNYLPDSRTGGAYVAESSVTVKILELSRVGEVVDLIGTLGLSQTGGINFGLSDELLAKTKKEAREEAVQEATKKAEELATLAGMKLGRVVNIQEGYQGREIMPMYATDMAVGKAEPTPATIEPGSSDVAVTVTLSYETR